MEAGEVAPLQRNAPVGVVFHLLLHEELFGKTKEELLIEAEEVAPLQRKNGTGDFHRRSQKMRALML